VGIPEKESSKDVCHWLYSAMISEEDLSLHAVPGPPEIHHDDRIPPYSTRHHWCTKPTARRGSLERQHKLLHLGLLGTCKQIYQEAALLSYSLNTFSFSSADTLTRFTSALIPDQRRALRAFYFRIPIHDDVWSTWPWNNAITVALVKSLPGLRVLRLDLELGQYCQRITNPARIPTVHFSTYRAIRIVNHKAHTNYL